MACQVGQFVPSLREHFLLEGDLHRSIAASAVHSKRNSVVDESKAKIKLHCKVPLLANTDRNPNYFPARYGRYCPRLLHRLEQTKNPTRGDRRTMSIGSNEEHAERKREKGKR